MGAFRGAGSGAAIGRRGVEGVGAAGIADPFVAGRASTAGGRWGPGRMRLVQLNLQEV